MLAQSTTKQQFSVFPIDPAFRDCWELYSKHKACFWTPEEIDFSQDKVDWKGLHKNEKFFIEHILAFFAASDGIVIENLASKFLAEIKVPCVRAFYGFQVAMEQIHSETYSLQIEALVSDEQEKLKLFSAIETMPCVAKKAKWALKWVESKQELPLRVAAFACVEGIFFSGSFCALFWLKTKNKMPGLTFSNELISRDEGLHCDFACLLLDKFEARPARSKVEAMVREAVAIEKEFVCNALPVGLLGMNSREMSAYIEFIADRLLISMGYTKIFGTKNPFIFMNMISIQGKTNFFERRVGDYQKAGVMLNNHATSIVFDEDF